MTKSRLHIPAATLPAAEPVTITPESAGWGFSGLRVVRLVAGESRELDSGEDELCVLPLTGACRVRCEGETFELQGRGSVFERVSDFAYVPMQAAYEIASDAGGEFALTAARARTKLRPRYGPAETVPVEIRGAGRATRQVNNFCAPDAFACDRLVAVEVLTPAGNWSSYPAHKHDQARPGEEAVLEEIYYFRIAGPDGFGLHKTYTEDGSIDETVTVRDGDAFLIPRGYHGPCVATPNHDMYYLNVLAGPAPERSMTFCDDPTHHWVRETWNGMAPDPRVPMTTAAGRRNP